jgi:four helix bundle protein
MKIERFEELDVWQDARELCGLIINLCNNNLLSKDFTLRNQLLSSSGSIMDNIAEGYERGGNKELIQFLFIAKGSCGEARSQVYRALDFGYISIEESERVIELLLTISKKLSGFISYLKKSEFKGIKYK